MTESLHRHFSTKFYVATSSLLKGLLFQAKDNVIEKVSSLDLLLAFGVSGNLSVLQVRV